MYRICFKVVILGFRFIKDQVAGSGVDIGVNAALTAGALPQLTLCSKQVQGAIEKTESVIGDDACHGCLDRVRRGRLPGGGLVAR